MDSIGKNRSIKIGPYTISRANYYGRPLDIVEKDCGDHVQVMPLGLLSKQDRFPMAQGINSEELLPKREGSLVLSMPPFILKVPKVLPADENECKKVFDQALDDIKPALVRNYIDAYNKATAGTGAEPVTFEMVEGVLKKHLNRDPSIDKANQQTLI